MDRSSIGIRGRFLGLLLANLVADKIPDPRPGRVNSGSCTLQRIFVQPLQKEVPLTWNDGSQFLWRELFKARKKAPRRAFEDPALGANAFKRTGLRPCAAQGSCRLTAGLLKDGVA